jgi:hypothetical protein
MGGIAFERAGEAVANAWRTIGWVSGQSSSDIGARGGLAPIALREVPVATTALQRTRTGTPYGYTTTPAP